MVCSHMCSDPKTVDISRGLVVPMGVKGRAERQVPKDICISPFLGRVSCTASKTRIHPFPLHSHIPAQVEHLRRSPIVFTSSTADVCSLTPSTVSHHHRFNVSGLYAWLQTQATFLFPSERGCGYNYSLTRLRHENFGTNQCMCGDHDHR